MQEITREQYAATHTVAQLREMLEKYYEIVPPIKTRKDDLISILFQARAERETELASPLAAKRAPQEQPAEIGTAVHAQMEAYNASVGTPQVYQGAMHEASFEADALAALRQAQEDQLEAARRTTKTAWANHVAVVRSMGRTVRGRVIDTVLRTPDAQGQGRVCLIVQHDGHSTRRTLHRLTDVQFEPMAR